MAGKKKTTFAKLARERKLQERRIEKRAKMEARKLAGGLPPDEHSQTALADDDDPRESLADDDEQRESLDDAESLDAADALS